MIHFIRNTVCLLLAWLAISTCQAQPLGCSPQKWKTAIDEFVAADEKTPPTPGGIVFVGSSSIRLWDLPKHFPELPAVNRGFGGSELCDSSHYFNQLVAKHKPRLVVLYAGDNDVALGKKADEVVRDFTHFSEKMKTSLPEARLAYIAIKPSLARWDKASVMHDANERIAAECRKEERFTFVDIWQPMLAADGKPRQELFRDDGLHLNESGYQLWTEILRPVLKSSE